MTVFNLLKELGIPVKEIKGRFANKQIKINNVLCTAIDHDIRIQDGYWDLGDFLFYNMTSLKTFMFIDDIKDLFGECASNIEALKFLSGYTLLSISKKEHFVFITD